MKYSLSIGDYICYILGENHNEKDQSVRELVQQYANDSIILLEAPYRIKKNSDQKHYVYQKNSQILQLQDDYQHCLFCPTKCCPKYLIHIDIRCCDTGKNLLAQDLITQLSDYSNKYTMSMQLISLLVSELPKYVQQLFNHTYYYDINIWSSYLTRDDVIPHILINRQHPIAYYLQQLKTANRKLYNEWYIIIKRERDYLMRHIYESNTLSQLACLLVDILITTQLLLLSSCQQLQGVNKILVVVGDYHAQQIRKYTQQLHLQINNL